MGEGTWLLLGSGVTQACGVIQSERVWTCPSCGGRNETATLTCRSCGIRRPQSSGDDADAKDNSHLHLSDESALRKGRARFIAWWIGATFVAWLLPRFLEVGGLDRVLDPVARHLPDPMLFALLSAPFGLARGIAQALVLRRNVGHGTWSKWVWAALTGSIVEGFV